MIQRQARNLGNMGRIPTVYRDKSARLASHSWVFAIFLPMFLFYPLTAMAHQSTELTATPEKDASQLSGSSEPLVNVIRNDRMQRSASVNGLRMKRGAYEDDLSAPCERGRTWNSPSRRNTSPDDKRGSHSSKQATRNEVDHKRASLSKLKDAGSTNNQKNAAGDLVTQPSSDPNGNRHGDNRSNFYPEDLDREAGINEINDATKQTRSSPTNKLNYYSITRSNETRSEKRGVADSNQRVIREDRSRSVRSPDEEGSGAPAILPDNCQIPWSCLERASRNMSLDADPDGMSR